MLDQLDRLQRHAELLAVLGTAWRTGRLMSWLDGGAPDEDPVADVLRAHGVLDGDRLSDGWAQLVAGRTPLHPGAVLDGGPRARLQQVGGGTAYADLPADDRLQLALAVSPNPAAEATVQAVRRDLEPLEDLLPALEGGGSTLELGCGVGGRITALALAFPAATAIGVELDAVLAEYGQQRADALGVGDRVRFIVGDATAYQPDRQHDLVGWSQFFFPSVARAGALRTAFAALRPGGWVAAPVIDAKEPPAPGSDEDQSLAAEALWLASSGVPRRTTAQLIAELKGAGFVEPRVHPGPGVQLVRARRPT